MTFSQWLRKAFGLRVQVSRSSRRRKSRQPSRYRCMPGVELLEVRLAPALLMVNSLADSGTGSLRDAINASVHHSTDGLGQTGTGTDIIRFDPAIDGGIISLSTSTNDVSVPGATGLLISNNDTLIIDGQTGLTHGITIARSSSAADFRLFGIQFGSSLTLQSLTLSGGVTEGFTGGGGQLGGDGGGGGGGGSAGMGGAIFNAGGSLTILNSTLTGNTAQGGDGGTLETSPGGDWANGGGGAGMDGSGGIGISNVHGPAGAGGGPIGGSGGYYSPGVIPTRQGHGGNGGFGGGGGGLAGR
jgi:hypothetical protein